jgi:hypothetical protein
MRQPVNSFKELRSSLQSPYKHAKPDRLWSWVQVSMAAILLPFAAQMLPLGDHPGLIATAAAADPNPNCSLIVPPQPLTAKGLATPYQMVATDPAAGPCNEAVQVQAAFVQAAVFDPATSQISIYNPLIVDKGQQAASPPVVPTLPPNAIVALWFGSNNGGTLSLDGDIAGGKCVNGLPPVAPNGSLTSGSKFGQVAYCNAPAFFSAANNAVTTGKLKVPPLGVAKDGKACPSVRDFSIVDQDQSDNVLTTYLVTADGKLAQETQANKRALAGATQLKNASDNRLVAIAVNTALGCSPWMTTDLADPGQKVAALPLNEIQAKVHQASPIALVPGIHAMALDNGNPLVEKLNAYRAGVNQHTLEALEDPNRYCRNLFRVAPARFNLDTPFTKAAASPDPAAANSLFTFLAQRFVATNQIFGCTNSQAIGQPVTVTTDANGVAIDATIDPAIETANQAKLAETQQADNQLAAAERAAENLVAPY